MQSFSLQYIPLQGDAWKNYQRKFVSEFLSAEEEVIMASLMNIHKGQVTEASATFSQMSLLRNYTLQDAK